MGRTEKKEKDLITKEVEDALAELEQTMHAGILLSRETGLFSQEVSDVLSAEINRHITCLEKALGCTWREGVFSSGNGRINWGEEAMYCFFALYITTQDSEKDAIRNLFIQAFFEEDDSADEILADLIEEADENDA